MSNDEWRVLIADDEPAARRGVRQLLAPFPQFVVSGECRNGAEVLIALASVPADVIFLDIQMPGLDGFEVIRRRSPERMPAIVFLTAYDQFAVRAFEAQAFDYLVKPVSQARFAATIARLTRHLRASVPSTVSTIVIPDARATTVLPVRDIEWIEAADNYSRIWVGGRSYLLRESLRELERRVGASGFLRAHRRALVQIARVRALRVTDDDGLEAILESGKRIPVSRRRRAAFAGAVRALSRTPGVTPATRRMWVTRRPP